MAPALRPVRSARQRQHITASSAAAQSPKPAGLGSAPGRKARRWSALRLLWRPRRPSFHLHRIRLTRGRIGLPGEQLIQETFCVPDGEDRDGVHAGAPFLATWRAEAQRHAAHLGLIVRERTACRRQQQSARLRNASEPEDVGFREARAGRLFEEPGRPG
ncbi:hypothetical protein MES5069_1610007 [Mesorhizobium escarrei]|uniref:Uncharacterized protein n=1 Tax=Mesorhizobium escarrei TaxID=666018 RepID=A0ABM9DLV9_9HYPH|nr:hypothetical protein MES5069_1610007 [Mesorhizobium escarrei]